MKKLLLVAVLIAVISGGDNPKSAQDNSQPSNTDKPLKIGDPAPLLQASKWLQGEEVRRFQPGKIYVIEFWATWCGPCIMIMPHLAELYSQYKDRGVTFLSYSAQDPNNTEEKVTAFVKKRGPKLGYGFAYADDRTTYNAWMTAAGQNGIPCAFVVDKVGRIAYIGHPLFLGIVLPHVLAEDANAQAISDEVSKIQDETIALSKSLSDANPKVGLQTLRDFEAKYPALANNPYDLRERLNLLLKLRRVDEAKKLAEEVVAKAVEQDDWIALGTVSVVLRGENGNENKELMQLAVRAAEAMVRVQGNDNARALINLARTYFAAGDKAKAKEIARKAIEAASGEPSALKQLIEKQAKMLDDERKQ